MAPERRHMETRSKALQQRPNSATGRSESRAGEFVASRSQRAANGLGWLSMGLGFAEVALPGYVARAIGARDDSRTRRTLVAFGLRELMAGAGILAGRGRAKWVWSRVAGDAMDLAYLVGSLGSRRTRRRRLAAATSVVAGVTALDTVAAIGLMRSSDKDGRTVHVVESITVSRSPGDAYRYWRNFTNHPRFMKHLESVSTSGNRSIWRLEAPAGVTLQWEAEITEDIPNEHISWRALDGARVPNWGTVRFRRAPGGRGTEVRVELNYTPPGGSVTAAFAKLVGREPGQQLHADLKRFKQVMETGELVASDASIHAGMHAARPSKETSELGRRMEVRR